MSGPAALACGLDALMPEERARHASLRRALESAIVGIEELPEGFALSLPADPELLVRAVEWITLERVCCPFLRFELAVESVSERAILRVSGPGEVKEFLRAELRADARGEALPDADPAGGLPPFDIGPLRPEEVPYLVALLEESGLPLAGVTDHLDAALVAREDGRVVGSAVVEVYGREALLRSVAVANERRGRGLGLRLSDSAVKLASGRGVEAIYLLTETAGGFFPKLGFRVIFRSEVPASVQRSAEFRGACPASAIAMELRIGGEETRERA